MDMEWQIQVCVYEYIYIKINTLHWSENVSLFQMELMNLWIADRKWIIQIS
jgi:hypothetical protein